MPARHASRSAGTGLEIAILVTAVREVKPFPAPTVVHDAVVVGIAGLENAPLPALRPRIGPNELGNGPGFVAGKCGLGHTHTHRF